VNGHAFPYPKPTRAPDEGVALLLALLFVVLLTVLVVEHAYEMRVEASFVENNVTLFQAELAARSAVAYGYSLLAADLEETAASGQEFAFDSRVDLWAEGLPCQQINDALMQCRIQDEYGKLNINALVKLTNGEENEYMVDAFRSLIERRGGEPDVVDAILDWIDTDDEMRPAGAEADYYAALDPPYGCKNGPMGSVEELLLVVGMTSELFFGDPENPEEFPPLTELLTVHGDPLGRVNVNTAKYPVLEAMADAIGQSGLAETILDWQENGDPVTSRADAEARGLLDPIEQRGNVRAQTSVRAQTEVVERRPEVWTWSSDVFQVEGMGLYESAMVRIQAFVWRDSGQEAAEMFRTLDWRVTQ